MTVFRRRRAIFLSLALISAGIVAICILANPAPLVDGPTRDDCVTIQVSDNGWHTNLYLPASAFSPDHTFRQDYPWANWFVIGWGDETFYRFGPTVGGGIDAIIPPSPTVLHVIALDKTPDTYFADRTIDVGLSLAGLNELARQVDQSLERTADGEAITVAEGHYPDVSRFYRSGLSYHAFHTCNQWTAGALRKSGVSLNAPVSFLSATLFWQLESKDKVCPADQKAVRLMQ
ncbi:MAG: hypothetical protein CMK07_02660 [Ponticaulis sp.]|nr:hypothetical protein [Ponticaulis sp.]